MLRKIRVLTSLPATPAKIFNAFWSLIVKLFWTSLKSRRKTLFLPVMIKSSSSVDRSSIHTDAVGQYSIFMYFLCIDAQRGRQQVML